MAIWIMGIYDYMDVYISNLVCISKLIYLNKIDINLQKCTTNCALSFTSLEPKMLFFYANNTQIHFTRVQNNNSNQMAIYKIVTTNT